MSPEEMQTSIHKIMGRFYRFKHMFQIGLNILSFPVKLGAKDAHKIHFFIPNVTARERDANKLALQQELALSADPAVPQLAFIGRLNHQKGIDLILEALESLVDLPWQIVFLGSGDPWSVLSWRTSFHNPCRLLQYYGRGSWPEDFCCPVGRGKKYHCCLVHHHPCRRGDGRIEFLSDTNDSSQFLMERRKIWYWVSLEGKNLFSGVRAGFSNSSRASLLRQ
jgi:glycosyltransferase involved in cell wall biosynthesis